MDVVLSILMLVGPLAAFAAWLVVRRLRGRSGSPPPADAAPPA